MVSDCQYHVRDKKLVTAPSVGNHYMSLLKQGEKLEELKEEWGYDLVYREKIDQLRQGLNRYGHEKINLSQCLLSHEEH